MNLFVLNAFLSITIASCQTGDLTVIADIDSSLEEASAIEIISTSNLYWTIEDAGNKNVLYGLDAQGKISNQIEISNVKNEDWEELTSDKKGVIYIGDIGSNSKKRDHFSIFKVPITDSNKTTSEAERIDFTLPESVKSKDFEAFFLYNNFFYIFSKEKKDAIVIKVPNTIGKHVAQFVSEFELDGKNSEITSADITQDGSTIALLNHDKVWIIKNFENDTFFEGDITAFNFNHKSQKEGVCFKNNTTLIISDEKDKSEGGNIYEFKL